MGTTDCRRDFLMSEDRGGWQNEISPRAAGQQDLLVWKPLEASSPEDRRAPVGPAVCVCHGYSSSHSDHEVTFHVQRGHVCRADTNTPHFCYLSAWRAVWCNGSTDISVAGDFSNAFDQAVLLPQSKETGIKPQFTVACTLF